MLPAVLALSERDDLREAAARIRSRRAVAAAAAAGPRAPGSRERRRSDGAAAGRAPDRLDPDRGGRFGADLAPPLRRQRPPAARRR